ncbi:MAG: hypothetical protein JWM74_482 [Myxococcaceae bacterium]|jgi:hypothetical protein|nr:hypothetical protein [Myxococcaceae bacterium]
MGWFRRTNEEPNEDAAVAPRHGSGLVPRTKLERPRSDISALGAATIDAEVYDLVMRAELIAIVSPVETSSRWEKGDIVTLTRVHIERHIAGRSARRLEWVRARGGTIGPVNRFVDGEASFVAPVRSLVFLVGSQVLDVVAGARGQFPIVYRKTTKPELITAPWRSTLAPPQHEAPPPFGKHALDEVVSDLADAWSRLHI